MYARDPFQDTNKTVFQSRAMLGRYCNEAPQKWPNWGTEFAAEDSGRFPGECRRLLGECRNFWGNAEILRERRCRRLRLYVSPRHSARKAAQKWAAFWL